MSAENQVAPTKHTSVMDQGAFTAAPKLYSHHEVVLESSEDVMVVFGITSPFIPSGPTMSGMIPNTVVFMTPAHFREFAKLVNEQIATMDGVGQ